MQKSRVRIVRINSIAIFFPVSHRRLHNYDIHTFRFFIDVTINDFANSPSGLHGRLTKASTSGKNEVLCEG